MTQIEVTAVRRLQPSLRRDVSVLYILLKHIRPVNGVPPKEQCAAVAALQKAYPWVQAGTDFFDGSQIVC